MARKSKLRSALDAHQGRLYSSEKQRKEEKQARKRKQEGASGLGNQIKDSHTPLPVEDDRLAGEHKDAQNTKVIDFST